MSSDLSRIANGAFIEAIKMKTYPASFCSFSSGVEFVFDEEFQNSKKRGKTKFCSSLVKISGWKQTPKYEIVLFGKYKHGKFLASAMRKTLSTKAKYKRKYYCYRLRKENKEFFKTYNCNQCLLYVRRPFKEFCSSRT